MEPGPTPYTTSATSRAVPPRADKRLINTVTAITGKRARTLDVEMNVEKKRTSDVIVSDRIHKKNEVRLNRDFEDRGGEVETPHRKCFVSYGSRRATRPFRRAVIRIPNPGNTIKTDVTSISSFLRFWVLCLGVELAWRGSRSRRRFPLRVCPGKPPLSIPTSVIVVPAGTDLAPGLFLRSLRFDYRPGSVSSDPLAPAA